MNYRCKEGIDNEKMHFIESKIYYAVRWNNGLKLFGETDVPVYIDNNDHESLSWFSKHFEYVKESKYSNGGRMGKDKRNMAVFLSGFSV